MIEINLVPDVKQEFLRAQRTRNLVISIATLVGIGVVGIVVVLAVIVGGQAALGAINDNTIKSQNEKLQQVKDLDNTVTLQNQLTVLQSMHEQKQINSRVFDMLSTINPPAPNDVTISNLVLDPAAKVLSIEGSAVNGYAAAQY